MKPLSLIILIIILLQFTVKAQVGINNPSPDSTAILDIQSSNKGILIPRMTSVQRNTMAINGYTPANSLLVFDTDLDKYFTYNGNYSKWQMLNAWHSDDNYLINYGSTNTAYKINISPNGGTKIFKVYSSFIGSSSDSLKFQSEFGFIDSSIPYSGIKLNAKISNGNFALLKAYYSNQPVMTLKSNGNLGLGYTNPTKKLEVSGDIKVSGEVTAALFVGKGTIPIGGIIIWSGSIFSIPSSWALCDGNDGTPNLIDRFIIGNSDIYPMHRTGGSESVTLNVNQLASHNHTGSTNSKGEHIHFVTRHHRDDSGDNSIAYHSEHGSHDKYKLRTHKSLANKWKTSSAGNHSHSFTTNTTGGGQAHENRPPYYALAYIIRIN